MSSVLESDCTKQEVVSMARWLLAENTCYTNYIHSAMYEKQMELTAKLHEAQERSEHLAAANDELKERISRLTVSYATLILDAMTLAQSEEHMPTPSSSPEPQWRAQPTVGIRRSVSTTR